MKTLLLFALMTVGAFAAEAPKEPAPPKSPGVDLLTADQVRDARGNTIPVSASTHAAEVMMGPTGFTLPTPEGFALLTDDMKPYAEVAKRFVISTNERLALFLSTDDIALAKAGKVPAPVRQLDVQTAKSLLTPLISNADFLELKRVVKKQNEEIINKAQTEIAKEISKMSKGIQSDYDVDLNLSVSKMIPLPPHHETERSLSYSMTVKFNVTDADGKPAVHEGIVTSTFLHLKGKVLFIYAHGGKSDLEWTRTVSQQWSDAIIAANPSSTEIAAKETAQRSWINWSEVGSSALIGGLVGGLGTLVVALFKRKKAPADSSSS